MSGGRALIGLGGINRLPNPVKLQIPGKLSRESDSDGKAPLSKGKQPRIPSKVPKSCLSGKGGEVANTARRLA